MSRGAGTARDRPHETVGASIELLRAAALVALPLALTLVLVPSARELDGAALAQDLLAYPLVLVTGTILYACWRVAGDTATGWLAAGVTLVGIQGAGLAAIRVARPVAA